MRTAVVKGLVVVAAHQPLDIAGILSDEAFRHFTDGSFGSIQLSFDGKFAVAFQAAGGGDAQQSPARRDLCRFDAFNSKL